MAGDPKMTERLLSTSAVQWRYTTGARWDQTAPLPEYIVTCQCCYSAPCQCWQPAPVSPTPIQYHITLPAYDPAEVAALRERVALLEREVSELKARKPRRRAGRAR